MYSKVRICSLLGIELLFAFYIYVHDGAAAGARQSESIALTGGTTVHGVVGGSPQVYRFALKPDDYFHLSVKKPGTDIEVVLSEPGGRVLRSAGCSHAGTFELSEIATRAGQYGLQLRSCEQSGQDLSYEASLSQSRSASSADRARVVTDRLWANAETLLANYSAESTRKALQKYQDILARWRTAGDLIGSARALVSIARVHEILGDASRAAANAEMAAEVIRGRNGAIESEALVTLGSALQRLGRSERAMTSCVEGLRIARLSESRDAEARAQYFIGLIHYQTGNHDRAREAFLEADGIWRSISNRLGQARTTMYLAAIESDYYRYDRALEGLSHALSLFRFFEDRQGQATALWVLGQVHIRLGRRQESLNLFEESRTLLENSGDLFNEANLSYSMALTYQYLGESDSGVRFFSKNLAQSKAMNDQRGIAIALRAIGASYFESGDYRNSRLFLERALSAFRELSNMRYEAYALRDIGLVAAAVGDNNVAMKHFDQALELSHLIMDRRLEASILLGIGHIQETAANHQRGLELHEQALQLAEATNDSFAQLNALYRISVCLRKLNRLEQALVRTESAIEAIEKLRSSVVSSELRTSYFASVRQQYELFIDLLMRLRRNTGPVPDEVRALEASERSRARTLLDNLAETRLSISEGADPKLVERENSLRTRLEASIERYTRLRTSNPASVELARLSDEVQSLTTEHQELQAQIRTRSPRYAALVLPEPLKLSQIQSEILDKDSILLEYSVGEESTYLWTVTRDEFTSYVLPNRQEIDKKVRRLRELMAAPVLLPGEKPADLEARLKTAKAQYPQAAAELSRILLGPAADKFGTKRLVIVAEGVLQYLPFAALPTPRSADSSSPVPLAAEHEIVNLPSASSLAVIRREAPMRGTPDRTLAVFADPVFEAQDPRVKPASTSNRRTSPAAAVAQLSRGAEVLPIRFELPRLLATRREAEAILGMVPENSRLGALGFNATRAAAMNPDLKRYRIVHFATHTVLDDKHPDLSSLVLSLVDQRGNPQSGFLRLRDMYNLSLSAELVVLSACDTALGKEVKGEGLMSMVRGFMYSGTPRVLASLWKVDDEATAELMTEFYKQHLEFGLTPAAALQQAQIVQMRKTSRQSPYYWAGFQLQGEWK